jgi:predicted DCC family thiol-disulfide oxidoreductase YuxK
MEKEFLLNQNGNKLKNIIIFDGVCNLCNSSINFIIKRDKAKKFFFTPIQSDKAKELMSKYHFNTQEINTLILIKDEKCFSKSDAVIEITKELSSYWYIFSYLKILPKSMRDYLYDVLSSNRYKLFGKKNVCMIPTKELVDRFLD